MKVIDKGKLGDLDKWSTQITCKKADKYDAAGCGAVLEINFKDLVCMHFEGSHFDHYYPAVKCPQCGKYTRVRKVPQILWKKMNTDNSIFDGFSDRAH